MRNKKRCGLLRIHVPSATLQGLTRLCLLALAFLTACKDPGELALNKGLLALKEGNYTEAVQAFDKSISKRPTHPDNPYIYNLIGMANWKNEKIVPALNAFQRSHELKGDIFESTYNLGALLIEKGDVFQAESMLEEAAKLDAKDTRAYELLAEAYRRKNDLDKAASFLSKAKSRAPNSPTILTRLAVMNIARDDAPQAEAYLRQALKLDPEYAPALYNMGILYESYHNNSKTAANYFKKCLSKERDTIRQEKLRSAISRIELAIAPKQSLKTTKPLPSPKTTDPKKDSEGATHLTVVSQQNPTQTPDGIHHSRVTLPTDTNKITTSVTPVSEKKPKLKAIPPVPPKKILKPKPVEIATPPAPKPSPITKKPISSEERNVNRLISNAHTEAQRNDTDKALHYCLQAAASASRVNRIDLEKKALETAGKLCPDQPRAQFALGRFYHEHNECDKAVKSYRRAVKLNPKWISAHHSLAEAATECQDYQPALSSLKKAVRLAPSDPDSLWSLAVFYDEHLNIAKRAIQTYQDFVEKFSRDQRTRKAKQRIVRLQEKLPLPPVTKTIPEPPKPKPVVPILPKPQSKRKTDGLVAITRDGQRVRAEAIQFYNQGTALQNQNKHEQASQYYLKSIQEDDSYAPAHYNLGVIFQKQGKYRHALDYYERALGLKPDLLNARYNLALVYRALKWPEKAIEELNNVIRQSRNHAPSYHVLGSIYNEQGNPRLARHNFRRFVELAPHDPNANEARQWLKNFRIVE